MPADVPAFKEFISELAAALVQGNGVVLHCNAGIGRTGTAAVAILRSLGVELQEATSWVADAGSGPETPAQRAFLEEHFGIQGPNN